MQRRLIDYLIISLKGMAMGAADVVPGVSGGTIAFISGIYEELLESIDGINFGFFKNWKKWGFSKAWDTINGNFLLALFTGIAISILSLAKGIKWLLANEPVLLWSFFFGLVVASIFYIGKQIKTWNLAIVVTIIVSTIASYFITITEPFASPDSNIYLFFCGVFAIIAMILPGISGAFILLLLGAYQTAINTVDDLVQSLTTLNFELFKDAFIKFLMLAFGAIVGIKSFSKVLNWMFKHYKSLTLAMLTGFMIGSLNKIWPWKKVLSTRLNSHGENIPFMEKSISPFSFDGDNNLVLAICFIIIGFLTIFLLEKLGSKTNK
jgi:putative membrane protein